jgi:hypothetical protein
MPVFAAMPVKKSILILEDLIFSTHKMTDKAEGDF